jgi:hypothetical protein
MPSIKLTDNSSLAIVSNGRSPSYLQTGLEFLFSHLSPEFKDAETKQVGDLDAGSFPLVLMAAVPGAFNLPSATLNVKQNDSAALDLLTAGKKREFLKALNLDEDFAPALISFAFKSGLESGPSGTVGDFTFGLTSGQGITVATYASVAMNDSFIDVTRSAIDGLTLPHGLDDLRRLPQGNICQVQGKGSLKFSASVQYEFLNNALATAPFEIFSDALTLNAQSGPTFQISVEHSDAHQLTIASLGNNKVRVGVGLTAEADVEESLDFSLGITPEIGTHDALQFLVERISRVPDKDLKKVREALPVDKQVELNGQIKKVLQDATKGGLLSSLHTALKQSKERNHLFVYDIDLSALDTASTAAVEAALKGDFTHITAAGASLAGIKEVSSVSTLTLTTTHTLTIHLLGILNFSDVSSFVQKSKVGLNADSGEVILTASDIKISQNTLDPDHLREILTRSAMITIGAACSPQVPDFTFKMVFFLKKARVSASDLQQFSNVLTAVSSSSAQTAAALLQGSPKQLQDVFLYLSLDLKKETSVSIFLGRTYDDFVLAGQKALTTILAGDPDSAGRLPLLSVDLAFWKQLSEAGDRPNILQLLATRGINNEASATDFLSVDWWAQAMGKVATALANKQPLLDAEKDALKKSEGGFDEPWALLATRLLAGSPPIDSKLTFAGPQTFSAASS